MPSRNAPCPCGSGKKYKKCCGSDDADANALGAARPQEPAAREANALVRNRPADLQATAPLTLRADRPPPPGADVVIDPDILPLVRELNDDLTATLGACSGHGEHEASVDLAVRGMSGMRAFAAAIDVVDRELAKDAIICVALGYSSEIGTACDFEK